MALNKGDVASRIRQFAEMKQLKLKDLAILLDMSPQSLQSGYLSGKSLPGAEILIKLYNAGCDIVWLLTGEKHGVEYNTAAEKDEAEELKRLRAENEAFRDALAEDVVECILKRVKEI